jgi:hypothetical protein
MWTLPLRSLLCDEGCVELLHLPLVELVLSCPDDAVGTGDHDGDCNASCGRPERDLDGVLDGQVAELLLHELAVFSHFITPLLVGDLSLEHM